MIWSRADSWDHNARLPAAAWQIQKEGASDTGRLLQTAFNYFKLSFRKQLRQGGGKTTCLRINSQLNAKWTQRYIFRCFLKGWQPFKGAAARGENVPELKQPSFQITVSWLQLWIQGKTQVSRKLKKRQYTRWCFSAIYAELNEVHIYMRALIMNLTSTMTNCSTDNHMLLNVKYYSTLHVAWGKEKQRNNCHYGNFDTNSSRLYKVTRESKENVDPSLLSWSNIFPCEGAASHSGGCASGGNWLTLADWQLDLPGYKNVLIPSNLLFPSFFLHLSAPPQQTGH